ncbi:uncharacterized protein LOC127807498 [Diospyros lotus]|uniref:uncharacterized protein LOC127807498 n=1 Tax=Diospyros lotus TaxID=55363 RepID=UPI00224D880B|nr:uncharacterized protein LOC127807498 [Diospyros lotus]
MGFTKDQLLARLQELQIEFSKYDHPVVLTVEAQAKYVGHLKGALSKNLFLKDKKHRYYIVSALADTKVDLKVLSQRLGLGKAGLRMAPEESLHEILQVPLGCVTPFALVNDSAQHVSLLLDKGFKNQECCFFHPLSNEASISINARDLEKFLKFIGKDPAYVDLEANPSVGKDQPPDLATLVPSDAIPLPDDPAKAVPSQGPEKDSSVNKKPTTVAEKAPKQSNDSKKEKSTGAKLSHSFADSEKFISEVLEKTSAIVLSEIEDGISKQNGQQLGSLVSDSIRKRLRVDLINLATMFKNTAYTEGFHAGTVSRGSSSRCL